MKFKNTGVLFTSDPHFDHKNILKYCPNRKFGTVTEMNDGIIEAWNRKVKPEDTVFLTGDFAFTSFRKMTEYRNQLNGTIHLIKGNHDAEFPEGLFASITDYREIWVDGQKIVLSHFPFVVWNSSHRGSYNLHGHCHGTLADDKNALRMDVGIDCHPLLEPFSMSEVHNHMKTKEWKPVDHHNKETK